MFGEWIYYPAALLLLLANLVGWAGNFYRLPGNWLIVANVILATTLLPAKPNGLGLTWFTIALLIALAILGETFHVVSRRHRLLTAEGNPPVKKKILVGAGLGSLTCVLAGLSVPVIGSLLAVVGAVGGAAGGAWLGSVVFPRQVVELSQVRTEGTSSSASYLSRFLSEQQIRLIPRLLAGLLMCFVAVYGSLF